MSAAATIYFQKNIFCNRRFDGWTNTYGGQTLWGQGITRNLKSEKFISNRHEPGSVQFIYGTGPLNQLFILSDGWLATYKRHETTANGKRITKNKFSLKTLLFL